MEKEILNSDGETIGYWLEEVEEEFSDVLEALLNEFDLYEENKEEES